jgi:fumarate reductase subunit D
MFNAPLIAIAILFFLPQPLFAAPSDLTEFIGLLSGIVGSVVPLVVGLAVLAFFWGLANFILGAGNEQKRVEGKQVMIWGIIALFVIISVWGIVALLTTTFFGTTPTFYNLPQENPGIL